LKHLRLLAFGLGIALLAVILANTDMQAAWAQMQIFGLLGLAAVIGVYCIEFLCDTASWQLVVDKMPLSAVWLKRLFAVRLVGEAVNAVTPLGGMGGEPVKALLLRRQYGLQMRVSAPSLVVAKTVNMIAMVLFLAGAFILRADDPRLGSTYQVVAASGLIAFVLATVVFIGAQRLRLSSTLARRLAQWRGTQRLAALLEHLQEFDQRLIDAYSAQHLRFSAAIVLAFGNWAAGAFGVWLTLLLLGHPVSLLDAWVIEALTQLVRAGTFFVPANLGTQEGALVAVCGALTGSPAAGLATALIRRVRELIWIAAGLLLGWLYTGRPAWEQPAVRN